MPIKNSQIKVTSQFDMNNQNVQNTKSLALESPDTIRALKLSLSNLGIVQVTASKTTGTVAINNSTTITGTDTTFTSDFAVGDSVLVDSAGTAQTRIIASISSDTVMAVTSAFTGGSLTGKTIVALTNFIGTDGKILSSAFAPASIDLTKMALPADPSGADKGKVLGVDDGGNLSYITKNGQVGDDTSPSLGGDLDVFGGTVTKSSGTASTTVLVVDDLFRAYAEDFDADGVVVGDIVRVTKTSDDSFFDAPVASITEGPYFTTTFKAGTIAKAGSSPTVTGTGTAFNTDFAPGDKISIPSGTSGLGSFYTILSITNATTLTLTTSPSETISALSVYGKYEASGQAQLILDPLPDDAFNIAIGTSVSYTVKHYNIFKITNSNTIGGANYSGVRVDGAKFSLGEDLALGAYGITGDQPRSTTGFDVNSETGETFSVGIGFYTPGDSEDGPLLVLDGHISSSGATITGSSTTFVDDLAVGDHVRTENDITFEVLSIESQTSLTAVSAPSSISSKLFGKIYGGLSKANIFLDNNSLTLSPWNPLFTNAGPPLSFAYDNSVVVEALNGFLGKGGIDQYHPLLTTTYPLWASTGDLKLAASSTSDLISIGTTTDGISFTERFSIAIPSGHPSVGKILTMGVGGVATWETNTGGSDPGGVVSVANSAHSQGSTISLIGSYLNTGTDIKLRKLVGTGGITVSLSGGTNDEDTIIVSATSVANTILSATGSNIAKAYTKLYFGTGFTSHETDGSNTLWIDSTGTSSTTFPLNGDLHNMHGAQAAYTAYNIDSTKYGFWGKGNGKANTSCIGAIMGDVGKGFYASSCSIGSYYNANDTSIDISNTNLGIVIHNSGGVGMSIYNTFQGLYLSNTNTAQLIIQPKASLPPGSGSVIQGTIALRATSSVSGGGPVMSLCIYNGTQWLAVNLINPAP